MRVYATILNFAVTPGGAHHRHELCREASPSGARGSVQTGDRGEATRKAPTRATAQESPTPCMRANLHAPHPLQPVWWCHGGPRPRDIPPLRPRLRHSRPTSHRESPACGDGGRGTSVRPGGPPGDRGRDLARNFGRILRVSTTPRGTRQGTFLKISAVGFQIPILIPDFDPLIPR